MSDLVPEGWHRLRLADVVDIFNGKAGGTGGSWLRVFKTRHVYDGFLRLTDPAFVPDSKADKIPRSTYLQSGDTLTPNMAHGTIGRVAFARDVGDSWTVDGQVMVLRPKTPSILGRYVFDWMSRPQSKQHLVQLEKGGAFDELRGQTHIYRSDVETISILVPPLQEQKKIAAILSSVDDVIESTQAVIDQLQVVKKSMMAELLTRGLPGRHTKFKMTEIGEVPEEWKVARIGRICEVTSGGTPSRDRPEFWNGGIPWVKTGEINYGTITETEETISAAGVANSSAKIVPKGSLLMAMYGQGATRGRVALLGIDASLNQACLAICQGNCIDNQFLFHVLADKYDFLRSLGHEGTQKNLSATLVKEVFVPIPPKIEQARITELLNSIDARLMAEVEKREAHEHAKSALISALLTGEVRVKLDKDAP